jgi:arsenate reductase
MAANNKVTIYHNPRCSKSREALQLLRDAGHEPQIVEYLKEPPSIARMTELLKMMKLAPRDAMRSKEAVYKELDLGASGLSDADLIAQMVAHPILIERPIVVAGGRARLGRPPETVLELFA